MKLNETDSNVIVLFAKTFLEKSYCSKKFNCVDFVREVYKKIDLEIPLLKPFSPPKELNISIEQLSNPPAGILIFLKDRFDPRLERKWTHIVISTGNRQVIHNSRFYGGKVIISELDQLLEDRYDLVLN